MEESTLIGIATFLYLGSSVIYLLFIAFQQRIISRVASGLAWAGLICHTVAIVLRWVESYRLGIGHAPLSNLYESMVFFSWSILIIYLITELKTQKYILGVFIMPLGFITLAATSLLNAEISPLVPALQSNWLVSHVISCFLGYAAFAVAFGTSLIYLVKLNQEEKGKEPGKILAAFPVAKSLEELSYKMTAIGFPLLTVGIVTGSAWANYAWGSYWSWDPKETWSLIVWLIYATYLHVRVVQGWRGRKTALLSIVGFLATLFCYLGVNLLLTGLHSYGSG